MKNDENGSRESIHSGGIGIVDIAEFAYSPCSGFGGNVLSHLLTCTVFREAANITTILIITSLLTMTSPSSTPSEILATVSPLW